MNEREANLGDGKWRKVTGWRPRHAGPATNMQGLVYMPEDFILEDVIEISPQCPNAEIRTTDKKVKVEKVKGIRVEYRFVSDE